MYRTHVLDVITQGCTSAGWQVALATNLCAVATNICGSQHGTCCKSSFWVRGVLKHPPYFSKTCTSLLEVIIYSIGSFKSAPRRVSVGQVCSKKAESLYL